MRKRVLLLANPVAGTEKAKKELMPIVCALTEKGCEVTVYPIEPEKGLVSESILRDAKGRFDLVMCIGGDGTLNHVINGMMKNDFHVPISYIPGGSTNDFSRNINGDLDWEALCCIAAGNRSFRYDIGKLNDRYFNYIAGFGAFTEISYSTNQNMKNVFGYGAYVLNMIAKLPQNVSYKEHVVVEHDGEVEEGDYVFGGVANTLSIGGVKSPALDGAELDDGLFEVVLITAPSDLIAIHEIVQCLSKGDTGNSYVKVFHAKHVVFRGEEALNWTVDGEYGGSYKEAVVDVCPHAMEIMAAPKIPDAEEGD
ncbi:MAG: diacylglycerol kinase family lipid kinase [Lachnospiraceae bacterium]|jgi:YegS/Rv2252/BmrU family lipid kinase|nr:diacylglycerol kinase family lipid kinase [Lachnospiraceae bacterium]